MQISTRLVEKKVAPDMANDPFPGFSGGALRRAVIITAWFREELGKRAVARARDNRPQNVTEEDLDDAFNVMLMSSAPPAPARGERLTNAAAALAILAVGVVLGPLVDDTSRKSQVWWISLGVFAVSAVLWGGLAISSRLDRQQGR